VKFDSPGGFSSSPPRPLRQDKSWRLSPRQRARVAVRADPEACHVAGAVSRVIPGRRALPEGHRRSVLSRRGNQLRVARELQRGDRAAVARGIGQRALPWPCPTGRFVVFARRWRTFFPSGRGDRRDAPCCWPPTPAAARRPPVQPRATRCVRGPGQAQVGAGAGGLPPTERTAAAWRSTRASAAPGRSDADGASSRRRTMPGCRGRSSRPRPVTSRCARRAFAGGCRPGTARSPPACPCEGVGKLRVQQASPQPGEARICKTGSKLFTVSPGL